MNVNTDEPVWILEMNENPLKFEKGGGGKSSYRFKGTCAEWGIINENDRLYDRDDYVGKTEPLEEKIRTRSLLGELDHNEDFLVELKNASHVITGLEEVDNGMQIGIELLATREGKNAMALADAKVPLYISSRASGYIDRAGKVTLERIYTYDLVSEPGFKNAELRPINESINIPKSKVSKFQIFKMKDKEDTSKSTSKKEINKSNESKMPYITKKDLDKAIDGLMDNLKPLLDKSLNASKRLVRVDESLSTPTELAYNGVSVEMLNSVPEVDDKLTADKEDYTVNSVIDIDGTEEADEDYKLRGTYKYKLKMTSDSGEETTGYISSTGEFHMAKNTPDQPVELGAVQDALSQISIKVNELVENYNMSRSEQKALVKYVDTFATLFEHQVNESNKTIDFVNKLADSSDDTIDFVNKLADHSDVLTAYANKLSSTLDKTTEFANVLADHADSQTQVLNNIIKSSDRATIHLNTLTKHKDLMSEQVNKNTKAIKTGVNTKTPQLITESKLNKIKKDGSLLDTVQNILNNAKTNKASNEDAVLDAKFPFVKELDDSSRSEFLKVDDDGKQMILESVNSGTDAKAAIISVSTKRTGMEFMHSMPKDIKPAWGKLPTSRKNMIIALFRSKNVNSVTEMELFWDNIDLSENQFGVRDIHENKNDNGEVSMLGYTTDEMDNALGL